MNDHRGAAYILFFQWLVIAPLKALNGWRRDLQNKLSRIAQNNADLQQALNKFLVANANLWKKVDSNRAVHEGQRCVLVEALIEPCGYVPVVLCASGAQCVPHRVIMPNSLSSI